MLHRAPGIWHNGQRGRHIMADTEITAAEPGQGSVTPMLIYILYILSIPFPFVTMILGVVIAYVCRDDGPPWTESHYLHQIHLFWKYIVYAIICALVMPVLIGFVLLLVLYLWTIIRGIRGIRYANRCMPYPAPRAWGF